MIRVLGREVLMASEDDSILSSIKIALGIVPEDTSFDSNIKMCINSCINILQQLGVHSDSPYQITDSDNTWQDYLGSDGKLSTVKSWMALKVKLLFDPPTSSAAMQAATTLLSEMEWRILMENET